MSKIWSAQQEAFFTAVTTSLADLILRARAGCGKTTTIVEAARRYAEANPGHAVMICAFNKRIAEELVGRLTGTDVTVKTLHALGFAAVLKFWNGVRVASGSTRADNLTQAVCGSRVPDAVKKLVSKLHTKGREITPHATTGAELYDLAVTFECQPDEAWEAEGFTTERVCDWAVQAMELAAAKKPAEGIDFADMIFLPVRNGWLSKKFDMVFVDEAQDMTVAQLEIARGICRGRIAVVGDDRQAIYGFRGADSESLDRLKLELNAEELGLTTTYRCGRSIVELASTLVPDFTAAPTNPEGSITTIHMSKIADAVDHGDFVLSRLNAPLVSLAMGLLRNGKRARVAGRDIGAGLKVLVRKLAKGRAAESIPEFIERVRSWSDREVARYTAADRADKIDQVLDQADMLISLTENAKSVRDLEGRIEALFTDDGLGQAGIITCSSVHRSKGLEADRVFILADTLRDNSQEERNIRYVAITRAKSSLVFVRKEMVA